MVAMLHLCRMSVSNKRGGGMRGHLLTRSTMANSAVCHLVTFVAMSIIMVVFVVVTMSIVADVLCTCCLVLMLHCG